MGRWLAKLGGLRHTSGTVISSTVQVPAQVPLVIYSYTVDGTVFLGQRIRQHDDIAETAATTVARYPSGAPIVVYYDPRNPADSLLEP
ncbi:MAG: DUF3592 domain-containing protein [Ilumatobacteraceae bacterium]